MLADAASTRWAALQCPHRKCVTKVVQARTTTALRWRQARFPQQPCERALNRLILERLTTTANEHMVVARSCLVTAHEVASQTGCCRLV